MASVTAAELLVGSDHDFVTNLYLAMLGRWPDAGGHAHFLAIVRDNPEARKSVILDMANTPEAMQRGQRIVMSDPLLPAEPMAAMAAQMALRTEFLHAAMAGQPAVAAAATALDSITPLARELRAELAALRRELRERLTEIGTAAASPAAPPPSASRITSASRPASASSIGTPDLADYVNDLLAVTEARMELRLRALEKRLP